MSARDRSHGVLFPLFLKLEGKRVVVVGGGAVGERKVVELLEAGAEVAVVAINATEATVAHARAGRLTLQLRAFEDRDLDGAWLAIAATGDAAVNESVLIAADARRIFVNAVDDPARASAYFASIVRRPPFTIAISSAGELPAMARLLREVLEAMLPPDRFIAQARALRRKWRRERTPMGERFAELVARLVTRPPKA